MDCDRRIGPSSETSPNVSFWRPKSPSAILAGAIVESTRLINNARNTRLVTYPASSILSLWLHIIEVLSYYVESNTLKKNKIVNIYASRLATLASEA